MAYLLKPLEWEATEGHDRSFFARVPGTSETYYVCFASSHAHGSTWRVYWSEASFPDAMNDEPCDSLEHGKQLADAHMRERVLPMLEPVDLNDPETLLLVVLDRLEDAGNERAAFLNRIVNDAGEHTNWKNAVWSDTPLAVSGGSGGSSVIERTTGPPPGSGTPST